MSCTRCEKGHRMVQAGRLGEEVVVRCPNCGAIVILDNDPGAPQCFPVNRIKAPTTVYVHPAYDRLYKDNKTSALMMN